MRASTYKPAFTLIEAVVCLLIMGIISTVVLPYCQGALRSVEARTSAGLIASILRYVKEEARNKNERHEIIFTPDNNNLQIEVYTGLSQPEPLKVGKTEKISLSRAYELRTTFHNNKAVFTAFGTSNGGSVYITDVAAGRGYRVSVLSVSGRVRVAAF